MSEAKERPIIFSGPMVRAILTGRKTQTRRVIKEVGGRGPLYLPMLKDDGTWSDTHCLPFRCPYGQSMDRLWVRETWAQVGIPEHLGGHVIYKADESTAIGAYGRQLWKPSIHMPRKLSRITLEIVGVRVERLQEITEYDAVSEGCKAWVKDGARIDTAIRDFAQLWEHINAKRGYSWASNPWVWVIGFRNISGVGLAKGER